MHLACSCCLPLAHIFVLLPLLNPSEHTGSNVSPWNLLQAADRPNVGPESRDIVADVFTGTSEITQNVFNWQSTNYLNIITSKLTRNWSALNWWYYMVSFSIFTKASTSFFYLLESRWQMFHYIIFFFFFKSEFHVNKLYQPYTQIFTNRNLVLIFSILLSDILKPSLAILSKLSGVDCKSLKSRAPFHFQTICYSIVYQLQKHCFVKPFYHCTAGLPKF